MKKKEDCWPDWIADGGALAVKITPYSSARRIFFSASGIFFVTFAISIFLFSAGCASHQAAAHSAALSFENGANLTAEIASTPQQLEQGLMFRESVCKDCGMLFVFPSEQTCSFWMKDTLVPLDIIFLSSNSSVIDIKENFAPCKSAQCESYVASAPCAYAIEANAGFARQNMINAGQQVSVRWN